MTNYNLNLIQYDRRLMHVALSLANKGNMASKSNWLSVKLKQLKRRRNKLTN